jgi:hypothetical protein
VRDPCLGDADCRVAVRSGNRFVGSVAPGASVVLLLDGVTRKATLRPPEGPPLVSSSGASRYGTRSCVVRSLTAAIEIIEANWGLSSLLAPIGLHPPSFGHAEDPPLALVTPSIIQAKV